MRWMADVTPPNSACVTTVKESPYPLAHRRSQLEYNPHTSRRRCSEKPISTEHTSGPTCVLNLERVALIKSHFPETRSVHSSQSDGKHDTSNQFFKLFHSISIAVIFWNSFFNRSGMKTHTTGSPHASTTGSQQGHSQATITILLTPTTGRIIC